MYTNFRLGWPSPRIATLWPHTESSPFFAARVWCLVAAVFVPQTTILDRGLKKKAMLRLFPPNPQ